MASLDDIVTTSKNIVTALNTSYQTSLALNGTKTSVAISGQKIVSQGAGRVVRVSVTTAGSANGTIYDAASTTTATSTAVIASIPQAIGVYEFNIPVVNGIVISPGTSQVLTLIYS
jgi:hypothetical protein